MEYLVTMTTHVPDGTSDAAVEDIRGREAAHTRELVTEGHLLRLWRPPLQPGEWRTLGLFEAADRAELESVLLSMPLRVWRTDEVAALSPHPNDPGASAQSAASSHTPAGGSEFFTTFTISVTTRHIEAALSMPPRRTRPREPGSSPGKESSVGSGHCPARVGRSDSGGPPTTRRCRRSWIPCRCEHGREVETIRLAPHPSDPGLDPG